MVFLIIVLASSSNHAYAGEYYGSPISVTTDKPIYNLGDTVTVTVGGSAHAGDDVILDVFDGIVTQKRIFSTVVPFQEPNTTITFKLPAQDKNHVYLMQTTVHMHEQWGGWGSELYGGDSLILTKQGGSDVKISNLTEDKTQVRPGGSVGLQFQVTDGLGNVIPWARATIGICLSEHAAQPEPGNFFTAPSLKTLQQSHFYVMGDCPISYRFLHETGGIFKVNFPIPNYVPQGNYKLNIWSSQVTLPNANSSLDLTVSGVPEDKNNNMFFQAVYMIVNSSLPQNVSYGSQSRYVTYGDNLTFAGFQYDDSGIQRILGKPSLPPYTSTQFANESAIQGVLVNFYIVDPYGKIIFNDTETTDNNGAFHGKPFHISKDLKRGLYDVYYDATKDGHFVYLSAGQDGTSDYFYLTNQTLFNVNAEGKLFHVGYYGVDTDASNLVFNGNNKSLTFDVSKLAGTFNRNQTWAYGWHALGCPMITIEKPLLTGPFNSTLDGIRTDSCGLVMPGSDMQVFGPIEESGKLTITGTYVIPEFPFAVPVLLISIASLIVFHRMRYRPR